MATAYVPNSHPSVTPRWKPYSFPREGLLEAIQTTKLQGEAGLYAGSVPRYWCTYGGRTLAAHGGFCVAVLMMTAHRHCREVEVGSNTTIPVSVHTEFLEPMPPGEFHVRTKLLQGGSRHSLIQAELVPADPKQTRVYSTALVRLGPMSSDNDPNDRQLLPFPIPNRVKDCDRWTDAVYYSVNPPASSIRVFCPNDKGSPLWSDIFGGQNCRYQWTKLDDDSFFSIEYLPILADLIPPIPLNYGKEGLKEAFDHKMPTISLTITFLSSIEKKEWLLTRTTMNRLHNGRFDMSTSIIDESGKVVATSTQLCAMIPRTRRVHSYSHDTRL
ncbi:hypothetical protein FSARC_12305 [Fusarium sarcochroum]|uniref:Thioesterase-like superfamily-domain-containing protein n=1 Tax=Fusarium sarcochroum TaxID=1208366 RepID=A0A8H4WXW1_9HYPO|nr:hypothetical protein FSARC_12305 [Fusarium sarcochroum]